VTAVDIARPVESDASCRLVGRLHLHFAERETERAYRAWRAQRALPFIRVTMLAALIGWVGFAIASMLMGPELNYLVLPVIGFMGLPLCAAILATTYWERWRAWLMPVSAVGNTVSGLVAVLLLQYAPPASGAHFADVGAATAMVFVYFGCTMLRLPPVVAASAMAPYVLLQEFFLLQDFAGDPDRAIAFTALLAVAAISGLMLSGALERQWRMAFQQARVIAAQQETIAQERERAERLLRSILPEQVAEQLKTRPGTVAEAHDEVTVLFADLVGFTPLSAELSATALVALLNEVFSRFDALCEAHGVEKIKTIGDAYMAVAGVPRPRPDHAEACADLALAMRDEVQALSGRLGRPVDFRIGMHLGPVVAGVIGTTKFAYDLWGESVNIAARMESHGLPGQIQVSEPLALRLRDCGYALTERGPIEIKGKGLVPTWLLDAAPVATA
jgi:adenylate cyclase